MITEENRKRLSKHHYVRKASYKDDYWLDLSKSRIEYYQKQNADFNVIIFSDYNDEKHFYTIPIQVLKDVLRDDNLTNDQNNRRRWVGNIVKHKLIIDVNTKLDIEAYYLKTLPLVEFSAYNNLLRTVERDLLSLKEENHYEGSQKKRLVNYYERKPEVRAKAIKLHGTICKVCGFDFEARYGVQGKDYIEVHHKVPLSQIKKEVQINIEKDLTVLCANCHRMIHRNLDSPLSVEELIKLLKY